LRRDTGAVHVAGKGAVHVRKFGNVTNFITVRAGTKWRDGSGRPGNKKGRPFLLVTLPMEQRKARSESIHAPGAVAILVTLPKKLGAVETEYLRGLQGPAYGQSIQGRECRRYVRVQNPL